MTTDPLERPARPAAGSNRQPERTGFGIHLAVHVVVQILLGWGVGLATLRGSHERATQHGLQRAPGVDRGASGASGSVRA